MNNFIQKIKVVLGRKKLNPANPEERKEIIKEAVQRTVKEYGETLKKLGSD